MAVCNSRTPKYVHVAEQAGWRGMAHVNHLVGLPLAAVGRSLNADGCLVADLLEMSPETRRDAAVIWGLHYRGQLTVFDALTPLAAELEFIAGIVDGPGNIRLHIDAVFACCDHLFEAGLAR